MGETQGSMVSNRAGELANTVSRNTPKSQPVVRLSRLIHRLDTLWGSDVDDRIIRRITADSRDVEPGDLFVAVSGLRRDGVQFVPEAIRRGARVVVSEKSPEEVGWGPDGQTVADQGEKPNFSSWPRPNQDSRGIAWIRVLDSSRALGHLASAYYGDPSHGFPMVGVTGTNGKTTTTYIFRDLFASADQKVGLLGTVENDLVAQRTNASQTTADAITIHRSLRTIRRAGAAAAILEVSSHALSQGRVDSVGFDVAVLTNLTPEHLDYHSTFDAYCEAKTRLFRGLSAQSVAVLNRNCSSAAQIAKETRAEILWYELVDRELGDFRIEPDDVDRTLRGAIVEMGAAGSTLQLLFPGDPAPCEVKFPLFGRHNVENGLAAAAAAIALGLSKNAILNGLKLTRGAPGRLESIHEGQAFSVLVDYAHTDDALRHVLEALRSLDPKGIRLVMGCGGNRDRTKRPRMGRVAAELATHTYVTSDNPRSEDPLGIIREIVKGMPPGSSFDVEIDRGTAIDRCVREALDGEIVLIAGKGHETVQVLSDRTSRFDDREVAREALRRRCL